MTTQAATTDAMLGNAPAALDAAVVEAFRDRLLSGSRDLSDADRVDLLGALEELKSAAAAVQARVTAAFDASQRAAQAAAGVPARDQGKGVAAQVGLARRESVSRGSQHLGLARILTGNLPRTLEALAAGKLNEWRTTLLVREAASTAPEHWEAVDTWVGEQIDRLARLGDRQLVAQARKLTYRLDPESAVRRARKATADRRVTCRPAPDTMAYLSALLPVKDAVAAYAALSRAADAATAAGDPRGRGQLMADTLVDRVTATTTSEDARTTVGVEVQVVMTDRALLHGDTEPAYVPGYGPIPAALARDWLTSTGCATSATARSAQVWVRRLYTHPHTGQLVAMDSHRRLFTGGLRDFLLTRDQVCRVPWCDAPIRHGDHVVDHQAGGSTSAVNGQGTCVAHNHAKQAFGWRARPAPDADRPGRHAVEITTPTGHTYRSTAPPLPGPLAPGPIIIELYQTPLVLDYDLAA
jgi:hypothetical protein